MRVALQNPRIQEALVGALSFTHEQVVRLLRGESEVVSIVDGYLTLNVFPVVDAALTELQAMGLIPADVQLPDLSAPEAPEVLAQRLETTLGVTLPAGLRDDPADARRSDWTPRGRSSASSTWS